MAASPFSCLLRGHSVKPLPFLAALVPALASLVFIAALRHELAWYEATALFYGTLALAEGGYLATIFLHRGHAMQAVQERRAKTGAGE
ncbi:hypothetical protein GCM10007887_38990 [Methylobacterium haplocladii]|uniref:Uncharacterized protein n=1 Tax=Methylobacterium haplocladii TaxID=1176176 RepID=A0A512IPQ7_9HYPH|nr:hypothetical protein MHA02_20810 [Methylobacterium haplocladii]GLS61201.1 hypothetical protein GCM10007887_38990 [Methylobacterium haplocladii]